MGVKVTGDDFVDDFESGTSFHVDTQGVLYVHAGDEPVAVYAAGEWGSVRKSE